MGYAVAALYFSRFWRETRDRLFAFFALAFAVLALQRLAVTVSPAIGADSLPFYVIRLAAFVLVLAAIADKNWRRRAG